MTQKRAAEETSGSRRGAEEMAGGRCEAMRCEDVRTRRTREISRINIENVEDTFILHVIRHVISFATR